MKRAIYYFVCSYAVTFAVKFLGGTGMEGFVLGLIIPPIILLGYFIWKAKGISRRVEHEHWTQSREMRNEAAARRADFEARSTRIG